MWTVLIAVLLAVPLAALQGELAATGAGAVPTVTTFTDTSISDPVHIAVGSDGALWFTNNGNASIGRIATDGTVTNFTDPSISLPWGITAGPDGALWFTNNDSDSIGRITTTGVVTNYTAAGISAPMDITAGPDGALWFTNNTTDSIGRIATDGTITNFADTSISRPYDITAGPDGALWFTNSGNDSIGRITTSGVVTSYTGGGLRFPTGITAGPDGALWFTTRTTAGVGRVSTAGVVNVGGGTHIWSPEGITAGPDGALWFANNGNGSIGRATTVGTVSTYFFGTFESLPYDIKTGPDGALWFTIRGDNAIGRITADSVPGVPGPVYSLPFGDHAAKVVWAPPFDKGGSAIAGYVVTPYLGVIAQPARALGPAARSVIIGGLQDGTAYHFTVAARNRAGPGPPSVQTATMIPGSPGEPGRPTLARIAAGSFRVTFAAPMNDGAVISRYTVACVSTDRGQAVTMSGGASPITVTGLTTGRTYSCTVKATNSRGTGPASPKSATVTA